jgi:hypothetical protein
MKDKIRRSKIQEKVLNQLRANGDVLMSFDDGDGNMCVHRNINNKRVLYFYNQDGIQILP